MNEPQASADSSAVQYGLADQESTLFIMWRMVRKSPLAMLGLSIIAFFIVLAILAPVLAPYDPTAPHLAARLKPPSPQHWFGTDNVGMDIFSRILYGARIDMLSSLLVVIAAGFIGSAIGMVAGWLGGWWDEGLMRTTDIFLAFPGLILAMAISAILSPNLTNALLAISVTRWPVYARLARAQTLAVKENEYIEAAQSLGQRDYKILLKHVLPNAWAPLVVQATLDMGAVLLTAAGLSFIGFGAQPPRPEWGRMVSDGRSYLSDQWWISTFPALAILLVVMGFNLLGDALRDLLDPQMR